MSETYATLKTNRGDIVIHLFPNHAPKTVENFVGLAEGTQEYGRPKTGKKSTEPVLRRARLPPDHREFMIQGGCPLGTGTGGPGYTFKDEFHPELQFYRSTCSRWRTPAPAPTARSSSSPPPRRRG